MRKYILRNRHTLLVSVIATFTVLTLLEGGLSGRDLFSFEIDNSFLEIRIGDTELFNELEILDDIGIDIDF